MAIHVPASKASLKQNQVEIYLPGDKKPRYIPKMQYLPASYRSRMTELAQAAKDFVTDKTAGVERKPTDAEVEAISAISALQQEILEKHIPGLYSMLTEDQISYIQQEWSKESGIELGESLASADS
ncbi:MAG TPA: hypothetical protein PK890_10560 [Terrimesophilobacter sp.]|nr:hypothetical protein [Terrimesophilobacter sp.]